MCLFVVDPALLARRHHGAPGRLRFLRAGLEALHAELAARGGGLVVRVGDPAEEVPRAAREAGAGAVRYIREVSPFGRARDERVAAALTAAGVAPLAMDGDLAVEPDDLPGPSGRGYRVFTPFHRVWRERPLPAPLPPPPRLPAPPLAGRGLDRLPAGAPAVPAGAAAAARLLSAFAAGPVDDYPAGRDLPAAPATSRLSPYLRFGMCCAAQIGREIGLPGSLSPGREAFWRQIAWREFFHHHLARNPSVARAAFQPGLEGIAWEGSAADLEAWSSGRTGVPLVDAAMRQLAEEGWVHNRARMVAASFLVKDLLVDWRRGETVFMRGLLDGDPANNNGGWQWTAGTGTDAAPYFRILNPVRQGARFDPEGAYVRRHLPELRAVPASRIHEPWRMTPEEQRAAGCRIGRDYPSPRVADRSERRARVLELYRRAREA